MSYLEKTARKLLPILEEAKKRMIEEKRPLAKRKTFDSDLHYDSEGGDVIDLTKVQRSVADMKNILGYLN